MNSRLLYGGEKRKLKYWAVLIATLVIAIITIVIAAILVFINKSPSFRMHYWTLAVLSGVTLCFGNFALWLHMKRQDCETTAAEAQVLRTAQSSMLI